MAEVQGVFEDLDADEYNKRQAERRDDDFIVDDEGYGYKDHGGEIWEVHEQEKQKNAKNKQKKLQVSPTVKISLHDLSMISKNHANFHYNMLIERWVKYSELYVPC